MSRTHPAYRSWLDSVADDVALVDGVLYSRDTLLERNDTFEVAGYAPGYLLIGQGGAGGFMLPADGRPGPVYRVDLGSLCEDDFEPIADTFDEWQAAGFPVE